jgi:selenophosphate synthetase-related protein
VQDIEALAAAVRAFPGLRNKAPIAMVAEVFGATDWLTGPGDDGALVGGDLVVGGEAIAPGFVAHDPYGAGVAAVLANVNDLAAMGAVPLAIVDTVVASADVARLALEGMRYAAGLYDVPVVGGHLTLHDGPPAISAFGLGRLTGAGAATVLSVTRAAAGQRLVVAAVTDGSMRADFPFFRSFDERDTRLAGDVRVLPEVAATGACVAAKDVSMAGLIGSLAMLLEANRLGVTVDLDALPAPAGVDLTRWLTCFPCFAFLLCVPAGREDDCLRPFHARGIEAAVVGTLDPTGRVAVASGGRIATVLDLAAETVTGLAGDDAARA